MGGDDDIDAVMKDLEDACPCVPGGDSIGRGRHAKAGQSISKKALCTVYTFCRVCRSTDMCSGKAPYCKIHKKSADNIIASLASLDKTEEQKAKEKGAEPPPSKVSKFVEIRDSEESKEPPSALSRFVDDFEEQAPSRGAGKKRATPDWGCLLQRHSSTTPLAGETKFVRMYEKAVDEALRPHLMCPVG